MHFEVVALAAIARHLRQESVVYIIEVDDIIDSFKVDAVVFFCHLEEFGSHTDRGLAAKLHRGAV